MNSDIKTILTETETIAVVGISDKPERDSGRIALFLKDKGYSVFGVHPALKDVFGIPVYSSLQEIPQKIDLVDVFLSSDKVAAITDQILSIKPKVVWYQLSVRNDVEAAKLNAAAIQVIQDKCIAIEHRIHISK